MQVNAAKQKMLAGRPAYGYSLGLGSALAAELLARCGIDFLLLETQHGSWGHDSAFAALMGMAGGTAAPMARVAKNEYFLIGKLLDQGAMGIVVPMVDTPEQARAATRHALLGLGPRPRLRRRLPGLDRRPVVRGRAAGEHSRGRKR